MPGGRGAKSNRGGYQTPANPAPVSGPGALSQRTDGGPGSSSQPLRPIPTGDGPIGTRQASIQQQQGAPMAAAAPVPTATPSPTPAGVAAGPPPPQPGSLTPLNAPTTRPDEPIQAGLPMGAGLGPEALGAMGGTNDPVAVLRAAYQQNPTPDLLRLILDAEQNHG